jgi:hypothetical protein
MTMWARVVEVMLACWLAISPFALRHPREDVGLWLNDLLCAAAVATFSLLAFWRRTGGAHLLVGVVGLWLIGLGYLGSSHPAPPASQNHILLGMTLAMLAIVPNRAERPPEPWQAFEGRRR